MSTPTPSLRRRATVAVLGLFALLLVVVGVVIDIALGAQLRTELDTRLADRAERAEAFTEAGFPASALPDLLGGQDIRVRVTTPDGRTYGDPGVVPAAPDAPAAAATLTAEPAPPGPPRGPGGGPPPEPPAVSSTSRTVVLSDDTRVLLVADTTQIEGVRTQLRAIMLVAGLATLGLAGVALLTVVARALRPLDELTALAGRTTAGDRGQRLRPDRAGTDLGRAGAAFDGMLDALESAEARAQGAATDARRAEAQTRRFLSDAAHELRTPLAGMQAVAEQMLNRSPGPDDPNHRRVTLLMRETARTSRLVTDMLELARIDSGLPLRPADADLAAIVDAETERLRTLAPGLTVTRTGARGPVPVHVDAGRIAQVLANLGDNARRHTPPGGEITLDLTGHAVTVTDTGPGVPPGERERIFERLVRLDDARDRESGGAGLGLAIARGLARAHGGDLTLVPGPTGASFRLTLPA
ncbi:HAMP domain-containing sensor histidine kinase [Pseudonocardia petroleophila]|uniref:histidine kinase n=1 Tax=Pseudonocardia petroleophila TaxID=37331 RepID=A0A7G7MG65_9PSEU|nr:HAMP domain-containing sensor histidine kinase [Pseudonocardia petroleophila]QNG51776.1 HAMP domain-containing histidine kinase [Pseudonocardia petroleophila]